MLEKLVFPSDYLPFLVLNEPKIIDLDCDPRVPDEVSKIRPIALRDSDFEMGQKYLLISRFGETAELAAQDWGSQGYDVWALFGGYERLLKGNYPLVREKSERHAA